MIAGRWFIALFSCLCCAAHAAPARVQIDLTQEKAISPDLMGVFFEDLNHAGDGGLYAELVQNRSFEFSATEQSEWNNLTFWTLTSRGAAKGKIVVEQAWPVHENKQPIALTFHLQGSKQLRASAQVTVLKGALDDTNDYRNSKVIKPVTTALRVAGETFPYTAPANSLTVIRVPR